MAERQRHLGAQIEARIEAQRRSSAARDEEDALVEREDLEVALEEAREQLATGARRLGVYSLAALVSLTWMLPVCVLAILVRSSSPQVAALDAAGARFGTWARSAGLGPGAEVVTWLGGPLAVTILSALLAWELYRRGHRRASAYVAGARVGAVVLSAGAKLVVDRERPEGALTEAFGQSFPSGHTLGTTTLALSILGLVVLARRFGIEAQQWWTSAAVLGGVLVISVIGATRLILGVHYLSDVLAGFAVGAGWIGTLTVVALALGRAGALERSARTPPGACLVNAIEAAEEVCRSDAVERFARAGFAARGVLWLVVGSLAVAVVLGADERTDREGALGAIAAQPGGEIAIVVLILALLGYAGWRGVMAAGGHRKETGWKRTRKRLLSGARGAFYVSVAGGAVRFLLSGPKNDDTPTWTARVMELPLGSQLVALTGAVVVGVGAYLVSRAVRSKHEKKIEDGRVPRRLERVVPWVGVVGLTGRGLVIMLIGGFLAWSGWSHDPGDARGLDAALKELAELPAGRGLVALAAGAMLAYALWSFCEAAFRDTEQ